MFIEDAHPSTIKFGTGGYSYPIPIFDVLVNLSLLSHRKVDWGYITYISIRHELLLMILAPSVFCTSNVDMIG